MNALVLDAGALVAIDRDVLAAAALSDAIDATVALLAQAGDRILSSDPNDLRALCEAARNKALVIGC